MKRLLFVIFVPLLVACSNGTRNAGDSEDNDSIIITKTVKEKLSDNDKIELAQSVGIDTTLYVDFANVLHSRKHCKGIARDNQARPLRPVRLLMLTDDNASEICSRCINSEALWALDEIVQGYKETEVEVK